MFYLMGYFFGFIGKLVFVGIFIFILLFFLVVQYLVGDEECYDIDDKRNYGSKDEIGLQLFFVLDSIFIGQDLF